MKRKNAPIDDNTQQDHHLHPTKYQQFQQNDDHNISSNNDLSLNLSLSLSLNNTHPPPQLLEQPNNNPPPQPPPQPPRGRRTPTNPRKSSSETTQVVKITTIPPPYPWATEHRARVHTMHHLLQNGVHTISGQVQCKKCEKSYNIDFNLVDKFQEVAMFIIQGQDGWHNRAPERWSYPKFLKCEFCGENESVKPLINEKKKSINWLFLLLGEFIGCCTLDQLKYFCKHTHNHRTGAKNRLVYLVYLSMCKQLKPNGPF